MLSIGKTLALSGSAAAIATTLMLTAGLSGAAAAGDTIIHSFSGGTDGANPGHGVVAAGGTLYYGVTDWAGNQTDCPNLDCGTFFKFTVNANGTFGYQSLYQFNNADGAKPSRLMLRKGGVYGTTRDFATNNLGTVFLINSHPPVTNCTITDFVAGGADGGDPTGGVIADSAGNLYGTAAEGAATSGVVFQLLAPSPFACPAGWVFVAPPNEPHVFSGAAPDGFSYDLGVVTNPKADSLNPRALYGLSNVGGTPELYELLPPAAYPGIWGFKPVYAFMPSDPTMPSSGLFVDKSGSFYGTSSSGGASTPCGSNGCIYQIKRVGNAWVLNVLYSFLGQDHGDGASPVVDQLVTDSLGNFYGTTSAGGANACNCGTIFEFTPVGSKETTKYSFAGGAADGSTPLGGVVLNSKTGHLYGTTLAGGANNLGTVFQF